MSKCNEIVCDICGEHIFDDNALYFKAKRRWYGFYERGFHKEEVCVCEDCQNKLRALVKEGADNG